MPFSEMFEFVNLGIPKLKDGSASGFEMDMRELMILAEAAKVLCSNRLLIDPPTDSPDSEAVLDAFDKIDKFVGWFYQTREREIDHDDLPKIDMRQAPNREVRRAAKAQFRNGRWS